MPPRVLELAFEHAAELRRTHVQGFGIDVGEHRTSTHTAYRSRAREERVRGHHDRIAGTDTAAEQRQHERLGARRARERVPGSAERAHLLFESRGFGTEHEDLRLEDAFEARLHVGAYARVISIERDKRDRHQCAKDARPAASMILDIDSPAAPCTTTEAAPS